MLKYSDKKKFVKFTVLALSAATLSFTSGMLDGVLSYPLPVLTGFTVKDLVGVAGFISFIWMHMKEV